MKVPKTKYIVVSGGVISGIGKGVIASSTGFLLKSCGFNVTAIKIDPYLNIDAGTMNPIEHGEVFVLDDGGEVDLDLGNYERFLDTTLTRDHNITTGKIYNRVIQRERRGDFLGATVQVIPHVTNEVMDWVKAVSTTPNENDEIPDICIIELGGTVGDIESAPFIEAMRQFQFVVGHENFALLHVSLVPAVGSIGEQKTKPTQSSIKDLRGLGLTPDFIMCRSAKPLEESIKKKISMFCHVAPSHVIAVHDLPSMYHVPLLLEKQGLITLLSKRLDLPSDTPLPSETSLMRKWMALAQRTERLHDKVTIGIVGKYNELHDAYASILKSLEHAALACNRKLVIQWINASDLEPESQEKNPVDYFSAWQNVCSIDGLLVPGGFGQRGTEGKIAAIAYARKNNLPFLGICLGMQLAIVEFARNVLGWKDANSTELDEKTSHPVVINMPEISTKQLGGTMRLGKRVTRFMVQDSVIGRLYGEEYISERHRHRYEVNTEYLKNFEAEGMRFVGHDDSHERMEVIELSKHKYFVGCQFHPEYKTRPLHPSPPFLGLILASIGELDKYLSNESSEFYTPLSVEPRSFEENGDLIELLDKSSLSHEQE